jgi:exopolysaccharide production protein ExoQ
MIPIIATFFFAGFLLWLFSLDRQPKGTVSKALWIPVIWLLIAGSRNVSEWLHLQAPGDQGERYLEGNPVDRAVLAALIALGIIVLLGRGRKLAEIVRGTLPVWLFFVYCGLSSSWSQYPDVAAKRWVRAIGDVVMVLVILTDEDWVMALKQVLKRVGFLLLPLSVLFIRYFPAYGRGYNMAGTGTFWTGVSTDKNGLGLMCLIFGVGAVWRLSEIRRGREGENQKRPLIAIWIIVLITLYLLWESNSMTSISCFVIGTGLIFVMDRWSAARKPAAAFLLSVAAVGISAFVLFGGAASVLEAIGRNPTLTGRTELWHTVLKFAQNPVVGAGYESFWLGPRLLAIGVAMDSPGIQEAHNGYLEIYLNLGWIGICLLGLVIVFGFRRVVIGLRDAPNVARLMIAYFVLALIYNFTEAGFKFQSVVWIFLLLSSMAIPKEAVVASPPVVIRGRSGIIGSIRTKPV